MSQQGYLGWFTTAKLDEADVVRLLKALPEVIGMKRTDGVYRDDLDEYLATEVLATEVYRLYRHGPTLFVEGDLADLGERVEKAIERAVPKSVRGDFMPSQAFLKFGVKAYHNDAVTEERIRLTAMVGCWGYSTPANYQRYVERIRRIPELDAERVKLERLMGQLKQRLFLSF